MRHARVVCAAMLIGAVATGSLGQDGPEQDWPRVFVKDGNVVIVYQPQIDRWDDFENISATAAVAVTFDGDDVTEYGSVRWSARTLVNHETRDVLFGSRSFVGMVFPDAAPERYQRAKEVIDLVLPNEDPLTMSLDEIVAYLDPAMYETRTIEVNLDPPPIYYSDEPAALVIFLGEPRFEPVAGTNLLFAVNTNWDLFLEPGSSDYVLLLGESWLTTNDLMNGPWTPAHTPPDALGYLPEGADWDEVRQHVPGTPIERAPLVFTSQEPAELIITDGAPAFAPIAGTSLLSMTNTESDLFLDEADATYYLLAAGRWFRAPSLEGPWSAATNDLPSDFSRIPADDPRADVLASVAGTPAAQAAVLFASLPKKATIGRDDVSVTVAYEGEPEFITIDGTDVSYAANTPYDVFRVGAAYYCCNEGIWFIAGDPLGPWAVCASVPEAIYAIPSTSPKYNVTYVHVYDSTPDTVVVGQTAGYTGQYVAAGLLMFGLGYAIANDDIHVHAHYGTYRYHPHYYSYGCAARYDYNHGGYFRGAAAYGPYGGAGRGASYNPATGTYARGAARYGPRGIATAREAYNPYTDRYAGRVTASNPYGSRGRTVVGNGDDWIRAGHRSGRRGTAVGVETSEGGRAVAARGRNGNRGFVGETSGGEVYAGRNGNVYRRDDGDQWQRRSRGGWEDVNRSRDGAGTRTIHDADLKRVQRDAQARQRGSQRSARYQRSRGSSGGTRRPAGRGSRGGGGRGR